MLVTKQDMSRIFLIHYTSFFCCCTHSHASLFLNYSIFLPLLHLSAFHKNAAATSRPSVPRPSLQQLTFHRVWLKKKITDDDSPTFFLVLHYSHSSFTASFGFVIFNTVIQTLFKSLHIYFTLFSTKLRSVHN